MDTSLNAPLGAHAPFPSQQLVPGCVATPPIADVAPKRGASAARIAALFAQLLAADEAARRHLAGELHDGPVPNSPLRVSRSQTFKRGCRPMRRRVACARWRWRSRRSTPRPTRIAG